MARFYQLLVMAAVPLVMAPRCTGDEEPALGAARTCSCTRVCGGVTSTHTVMFSSKSSPAELVQFAMDNCMQSCAGAVCSGCSCSLGSVDAGP